MSGIDVEFCGARAAQLAPYKLLIELAVTNRATYSVFPLAHIYFGRTSHSSHSWRLRHCAKMKAINLLLLAVALSCCLLCPASAQDAEASTWGKPGKPPKNCPAEAPFDPKTFNWGSIYTAYPVNKVLGTGLFSNLFDTFACLAPYALCAYANCTIVEGTNPPVAECGCQVSRATLKSDAYSCGTATTVLDKNLQSAMEQRCGSIGVQNSVCGNPPNQAPFCPLMKRNRCGKAAMCGGTFDVISTFNSTTWPSGITSPQGGAGPAPQYCLKGCSTNCFAAACHLKTAWNGMPATCYCPVYCNQPGFILSANSTGYECEGQSVNGKQKYIQNGI